MTQAEAVQLVVPGGRLTQGYGMTAYAKSGAYGGRIHDGWDIGAGYGTRINWPVPVSSFRWGFEAGGYGNYTQGFIGPWEFLFGHEAQVGNQSYAGLVDSTGFSSGNHTHLRVKLNGVTVDPQVFFNSIGGNLPYSEEYVKDLEKRFNDGAKIIKQHLISNASLRLLGRPAKQVELNNWSGNDWTPDRIMSTIRAHPDYRKEREDPQAISEAQAKLDQVKEVVCK